MNSRKLALRIIFMGVLMMWLTRPVLAQATLDLVIHNLVSTPDLETYTHTVQVFVSVVDGNQTPVTGLLAENFELAENSQKMGITSIHAAEEPLSLLLLLDTSGSMSGEGIEAAKRAAADFVNDLQDGDEVAVMSFNEALSIEKDFTLDHADAIDSIRTLTAVRNSGTCLFDAMYQAVQKSSSAPGGRRAVLVLTDGVDETQSGAPCSLFNEQDVIHLASEPGTHTPIYSIGLGRQIDAVMLEKISASTGGRFYFSPDQTTLGQIFNELGNALRSQYLLEYTTQSGPGLHNLTITAHHNSLQDTDTRSFILPNYPLKLSIQKPPEGSRVSQPEMEVEIDSLGQGEVIDRLEIHVNNKLVQTLTEAPYQTILDLSDQKPGELDLNVKAFNSKGTLLTEDSALLNYEPSTDPSSAPSSRNESTENQTQTMLLLILLGGILAVTVGVSFFIRKNLRRKNQPVFADLGTDATAVNGFAAPMHDHTLDSLAIPNDSFGRLTVIQSDDPDMMFATFDLLQSRTTLGRKSDNDIVFPKDTPVSRHHAAIEAQDSALFISEMLDHDEQGHVRYPTYGTYVNGEKLLSGNVQLTQGDEVRLGKRLTLKVDLQKRSLDDLDLTRDQF